MAKRKDVREPTNETGAASAAPSEAAANTPPTRIASEDDAEPIAAPKDTGPASVDLDAKLPPAAQLGEPRASPPPFLREHENRVIAARPAATVRPEARNAAPTAAREKPKSRFPLLAATLALAAGLGGTIGAVGAPTLLHVAFGQPTGVGDSSPELQSIKGLVAQVATDLGALRTTLEQSGKVNIGQFAKATERLERAQAEAAAKIAKISEGVERLERRPTAAAGTGQNDVTGSIATPPAAEAKPKPAIIEDYVVRRVFDGVALVEGRRGIVEVEPGATLPGAGRIEEIRRQDGRWVVVTSKGLIVSGR